MSELGPTPTSFDVIVIGGGPGGERAAIQAAKSGKRVALIEKAHVVGGTSVKGTLVDRLNAATLDALTRAASWMGVATTTAIVPRATPEPEPANPADAGSRITRKQLDYAISLARDRGIARDKLAARCLAEFQRKPEYLTRAQASVLIESLKKEAA